MRWRGKVLAGWCALGGWMAGAQNVMTQQEIEARLAGPLVMLRGQYDGRRLQYDARGNLRVLAGVMPLSLSAVRVDRVRLQENRVVVEATREGLKFTRAAEDEGRMRVSAAPWDPGERVVITIRIDPRHPEQLSAALDNVFTQGLSAELAASAPGYWEPWLRHYLHPQSEEERLERLAAEMAIPCDSEGVTPPRILQSVLPLFSDQARHAQLQGTVVLHMTVSEEGRPEQIFIWKPLGMGLDEQAVEAERRVVFTPALRDGQPVACGVNMVVRFNADGTVD